MEIRRLDQKIEMKKPPKSEKEIVFEMLEVVDKKLDKVIKLIKAKNVEKE